MPGVISRSSYRPLPRILSLLLPPLLAPGDGWSLPVSNVENAGLSHQPGTGHSQSENRKNQISVYLVRPLDFLRRVENNDGECHTNVASN